MNYYPFHIGDFRSGTVNMSRIGRWIYRDMIDVYYDTEKPLPLDLDDLCDQLGVEDPTERSLVERHLRFKFIKTDEGYRHDICDKVIAEYHLKADTARKNGKNGGRPHKPKANPEKPGGFQSGSNPEPIGNPEQTGSQANQEPITKNQEPLNKSSWSSESSREFDDDEKPKDPGAWAEVFANDHGIDIDHRSTQSRAKFWPLAKGWVQAGVTVGQMRAACAKARLDATEPIAWLPAYADRVLASMQAPQRQPKQAAEPEWRTEQRKRTLQAVPGIAARTQTTTNIIDVKATNVPAIALD